MRRRPVRVLELRSACAAGGGPEKTILLGAARADPDRLRVTVCYLRDARDTCFSIGARAGALGIDYVEIRERHSFDLRLWPALRRLARDRAIGIVHAHDYKTDLLALMLARVDGLIPVATAHGWTGHSLRERRVYYPVDRIVLRAFPITIAVSGEIRTELLRAGLQADRIRVILNGIDHVACRRDATKVQEARSAFGLAPSDLVVGSVGRLEPQKRFDLLIQACAALRTRHPRIRVLIAGEGSLRGEIAALAERLMPAGACILLGHRPDVWSVYHALDVFVQASDYEGTPNAVLEAMAFEVPVVATRAGGTAEIVEDGVDGLVVPTRDAAALAAAIDATLSNRSAAAARTRLARRRVETALSFDARMASLEDVYDDLLAQQSGRAGACAADRWA